MILKDNANTYSSVKWRRTVMFKYLISGASEVHPRYADFIFNSFRSPENGLSRYFEMRNLKCSLLPGLPILPLSTLFFSL